MARRFLALALVVLLFAPGAWAQGGYEPRDGVSNLIAAVRANLTEAPRLGANGVYLNLVSVVEDTFDFQMLSRQFAGAGPWDAAGSADRQAFARSVRHLWVAILVREIVTGDIVHRFPEITYDGPSGLCQGCWVVTVEPRGKAARKNYMEYYDLMRDAQGRWKVIAVRDSESVAGTDNVLERLRVQFQEQGLLGSFLNQVGLERRAAELARIADAMAQGGK